MFTGIIEEIGRVDTVQRKEGGMVLGIHAPALAAGLRLGDSLAVNGACLTVTQKAQPATLFFDVSLETLTRTGLGTLRPGDSVNLEPALTLNKPLGGHLVTGHVDGQATLTAIRSMGEMVEMTFEVPEDLAEMMMEKGSVALDGISLTIASLGENTFTVAVIPHTLKLTTLGARKVGDTLNLETDMIGKYVRRFLTASEKKPNTSLSLDFLAEHGFLK